MPLTGWKPNQSNGTLPNDFTTGQLQYRHFLHYENDMSGFGIVTKTGVGKWKIRLYHEERLLFEQEVQLTLQVVGLGVLYTWQYVREKIITTWIEPGAVNVVNPATALVAPISVTNTAASSGMVDDAANHRLTIEEWRGLGSPSWERLAFGDVPASEFGTMIPGGGSGTTTGIAQIDAFWQSPIYTIRAPVGSRLDVVMDSWGLGISTRPEYQWRFNKGTVGFAATLDRQGAIRMVSERPGTLDLSHTYDSVRRAFRRAEIRDASAPKIHRAPTGRIYVLALKGNAWMLWYSDYGGFDIHPVTYDYQNQWDEDSLTAGAQVALWSDSFTDVDITARHSRGYVSCAKRGGRIYVRSSADGIVPGPMKDVCPASDFPCRILSGATSDGRERLELVDGNEIHYESHDGGTEWAAVL